MASLGFREFEIEQIRPSDSIKALEVLIKLLGLDKADTEKATLDKLDEVLKKISE